MVQGHDEHLTPVQRAQTGFIVTRATAASTPVTEFDEFLYASINEEPDGTLSVLSALARLDLDPWDEAARLARLPRAATIQFLTALIAALPQGSSAGGDPELHARRLTALLPRRVTNEAPAATAPLATGMTTNHRGFVRFALFYIALIALFFGEQWLMDHSQQPAHSGTVTSPASGDQPPNAPAH